MAGLLSGRDARISHYEFCSTYVRALEMGIPVWPELRRLGMSDKQIEKRRWDMTRQGWMPAGQLTRRDAGAVRAMMAWKLKQQREKLLTKEREISRKEAEQRIFREQIEGWMAHRRRLREEAASSARFDTPSEDTGGHQPCLDVFLA